MAEEKVVQESADFRTQEDDKGSVILVTVDGRCVGRMELSKELEAEECISIRHQPGWGRTILSYKTRETLNDNKENMELKAMREAVLAPQTEIIHVEVNTEAWKVILTLKQMETGRVTRMEIKDFQAIIEVLQHISYKFCVSPIAPRATGR